MGFDPVTVGIVGAFLSAGVGLKGQAEAKAQAKKARAEQEKQLAEQRVLDAAAKEAARRAEEDQATTEVGTTDLTVGTRKKNKKTVQAAPNTGVRLA